MTVCGFRLITGEVILTQVTERNENTIKLKDAAELVVNEIEPGKAGVGLQPFIPYGKNHLLYVSSVAAEFELDKQIENEYNRIFGAGIVIASANSLPIQK